MLLYLEELLYEKHLSTQQITNIFKRIVKDDIIVCDSAELRLINDMRDEGINAVPTLKKPGSRLAGIQKMSSYKIIVCGDSPNLVTELNNFCWIDKGAKTVPIDKYDHILDSSRYALQYLTQ